MIIIICQFIRRYILIIILTYIHISNTPQQGSASH